MGLAWQRGPLSPTGIGRFLTPEPLPERLLLEPDPGFLAVAATNGSVNTVTRWLAVELGPIRVNAVSPGTIDTGAWDGLGEQKKAALFAERSAANPVGRIGTAEDVAQAVLSVLTGTFMTGASIPVDGGQPLV